MNRLASTSLFSWHQRELYQPIKTVALFSKYNIERIYQYVSPDENQQKIRAFLNHAQTKIKNRSIF